jgi:hypothetical protein
MSSEDFVSYTILKFLQGKKWHVLHYHPPGGHPSFSIILTDGIYVPDIVAVKKNKILVVENKPQFSGDDVDKMESMYSDSSIIEQITAFVSKNYRWGEKPEHFEFFWVHGYNKILTETGHQIINFIYVEKSGGITVIQSRDKPLIL